jgi:hypothetical protein
MVQGADGESARAVRDSLRASVGSLYIPQDELEVAARPRRTTRRRGRGRAGGDSDDNDGGSSVGLCLHLAEKTPEFFAGPEEERLRR